MEVMELERSTTTMLPSTVTADKLCREVTGLVENSEFVAAHKSSRAPLAILAFAKVVVDVIINNKQVDTGKYFNGITMTVPDTQQLMSPTYHAIVGQKLLYVDWPTMYGINVPCPCCGTVLRNERSNFSKNKILFPLFGLEGPPMWCIVRPMSCRSCKYRGAANVGEVLCQLPPHVRAAYPVETKYALGNKNSHLSQSATGVMDLLMPTYGNGELCSQLLYNAINRSYMERVQSYCSFYKSSGKEAPVYVEKDGAYCTVYPPLGDGIRTTYDEASSASHTPWKISDHDRHTQEIQSVGCGLIFAQDHTFEVTKNYFQSKQIGAAALWDVVTETGEIASAVLVPTTKTNEYAHAATQLARRPTFKPSAKYSDTWPAMNQFWTLLFGESLQGRLGLFHYLQRITKTLKKNHTDHFEATNNLRNCLYQYNADDYDNLLWSLKEGSLSGVKHSDDDIQDLRSTKYFKQRYDKYLRKEIRPPHIVCSMLDDWFDRYKCSASANSRPARGRKDPVTGETLFTPETREAIKNCKEKAKCIQDPLPLDQMYDIIKPSPNASHQLNEYLSRRGESCLESFHNMLAHFGNCGMRSTLADNLNLTGTARYSLAIRHKRRLISLSLTPENTERKKIPAACESLVSFFNHSELAYTNQLAIDAGASNTSLPFKNVEILPPDNGERFFSEYLMWKNTNKPRNDGQSRCLCNLCGVVNKTMTPQPQPTEAYRAPTHQNNPSHGEAAGETAPQPAKNPEVHRPLHQQPTERVAGNQQWQWQQRHQQRQPQIPMHTTHTHQQQQHQQIAAGYYPQNTPMLTQFQPWIVPTFNYRVPPLTPLNALFCCGPYRQWYNNNNRRDRPPHEHNCQCRHRPGLYSGNLGGKIECAPGWNVI
mgnify:CR=1 FL=1